MWKNLSIALIFSITLTGTFAFLDYYTILKPAIDATEGIEDIDIPEIDLVSLGENMINRALYVLIEYLAILFCSSTAVFYYIIDRMRRNEENSFSTPPGYN